MKRPPEEIAERLWALGDQFLAPGVDVSIEQVAESSRVPRATLYYYFSGKDDVVGFLLSQKLERGTEAIGAAAAAPGTPTERLRAVLRAMLESMAEHPALCTRLTGFLASKGTLPEVIMSADARIMGPLREILIEGRALGEFAIDDPAEAASALMGAVSQAAMMHILAHGDLDAVSVGDRLLPLLLNGVTTRSGGPARPRRP